MGDEPGQAVERRWLWRVVDLLDTKDGDTFVLRLEQVIDAGFSIVDTRRLVWSFRLKGYDTPELRKYNRRQVSEYEKQMGREAEDHARHWISQGVRSGNLRGESHKGDRQGRYLIDLWSSEGPSTPSWTDPDAPGAARLGDDLVVAGLATRWPDRWHEVYDQGGES